MGRMEEPTGDMKKCPLCDDSLATSAQLREHLRTQHPSENSSKDNGGERGFICCFCTVTFNTLAALHAHIPAHGDEAKLFGCRACARRFHFKDELENHVAEAHHVAKEEIKREREDSEEDNSEVEEEEREVDADGDDTGEIDAEGGEDDEEEQRGDNGAEAAEDRDSIVNVESEIKIDNDSYATSLNAVDNEIIGQLLDTYSLLATVSVSCLVAPHLSAINHGVTHDYGFQFLLLLRFN